MTTARQPAQPPRNRDLDDEQKRQALLKNGQAFLERIRGWGGQDPPPPAALLDDFADSSLGDDEELDDAALLRLYRTLGPWKGHSRLPLSDTKTLTGAQMLVRLRRRPDLLPHVYRRLKNAFQVGGWPLAMLLRDIADAIAPRRRGQFSRLSSDTVRRIYLNRVYVYGEVRQEYQRTNKLPPAELLPVIERGDDILTINDPDWPHAAAREYGAAWFDVSPHTIDRHVKRSKIQLFEPRAPETTTPSALHVSRGAVIRFTDLCSP